MNPFDYQTLSYEDKVAYFECFPERRINQFIKFCMEDAELAEIFVAADNTIDGLIDCEAVLYKRK